MAQTNELDSARLAFTLKTTVDAYNEAGRKDPKWDGGAREALEAVALAGKSRITIRRKPPLTYPRNEILFEPDHRHRTIPKIDPNQRLN